MKQRLFESTSQKKSRRPSSAPKNEPFAALTLTGNGAKHQRPRTTFRWRGAAGPCRVGRPSKLCDGFGQLPHRLFQHGAGRTDIEPHEARAARAEHFAVVERQMGFVDKQIE